MDYDEEVRRRKEYADRKVRERHEKMKKEMDEKRKNIKEHRERVQSQLRREQELIQKRMQQLNEDEERKKVTLAKQHTETSRIANLSKSPKQAGFGFGSATPRTLAYLDNLPKSEQLYDKRLKPTNIGTVPESGLTTPQSRSGRNSGTGMGGVASRPPPAARRPPPAMNAMTSSLYVAPNPRHSLRQPLPPPPKPLALRTTPPRQSPPSMMTQSVYTPSRAVRSTVVMAPPPPRPTRRTPTKPPIQQKMDVAQPARVKKTVKATANEKLARDVEKSLENSSEVEEIRETSKSEEPEEASVTSEVIKVAPEEPKAQEASEFENPSETLVIIDAPAAPETQETHEEASETPEVIEAPVAPEEPGTPEASELENSSETLEVVEVPAAPETQETQEEVSETSEVIEAPVAPEEPKKQEALEVVAAIRENSEVEKTPEIVIQHDSEILEDSEMEQTTVIENLKFDAPAPEALNEINEEIEAPEVKEITSPHPEDPESYELKYEEEAEQPKAELVDVFGNDFIGEKEEEVRRRPAFDLEDEEEADSGKASPSEDSGAESSPEEEQKTPRQSPEQALIVPLVKKVQMKSNEDLEKEQKEAENRKRRLEAILAKSRGMTMPTATVLPGAAQDTLPSPTPPSPPPQPPQPPTTTVAQNEEQSKIVNQSSTGSSDILSRLASQSNLPHLQKLLQRKAANNSNPSLETQETPLGGEIQYP